MVRKVKERRRKRKTIIVHCKKDEYDIYIGRPSKWGNPFSVGIDGNRKEVIEKYYYWLKGMIEAPKHHNWYKRPKISEIEELRGKRLGCFCKPKACHGDILLKILNEVKCNEWFKNK